MDADPDDARTGVRAFLAAEAPGGRYAADFVRRLAAAGYAAPHWPAPWGRAASPAEQLAIDEELRAALAPRPVNPIGIGWAGPTLLVAGSDAQQRRWLPGILDGSELWCQLFSEPEAGSDLASLTTRAVRDGDEYVVDGHKVWTTIAHLARWGILLARTDPDRPRRQGISYFVLDMHAPGVTVRPIRQMTGASDFNEVILEGVRVPVDHRVGDEGDGWGLARVTLGNERVSLSSEGALWGLGPTMHDVVGLVRAHGGTRDAVRRQRLAAHLTEAEVLRLIRLRTVAARVRGLEPGPEASVRKTLADRHGQHVLGDAIDLAGASGMLRDAGPYGEPGDTWATGFLFSPALTVGGGTSEVQRGIIAERILGLPRDVDTPEP
ncbi:MAG TPA: acyl-CoA dehydrogenase family protein [Acidimicrobiia bacterium]|nr:acyl-CoA dehydrogenase family protein [Acidimicrobiia bacterium]